MRRILMLLLISSSSMLLAQDKQTHSTSYTVELVTAHEVAFVVDPMAHVKNECRYKRPKPSINIICQPHNTPIFHILPTVPRDTIAIKEGEPHILTIYQDYHPDTYAWFDGKQAIEVTFTIYDYQGHQTLNQKSSAPTNQFTLPTAFTSGKCTVEERSHFRTVH